jgi:protein-tyrosine-phosphatase
LPWRSGLAFRVVLVSTHNSTCAAFAERLMRPALANAGVEAWAIRVTSAGLEGEPGQPVDPDAQDMLRMLGGNPGGFHSRLLDGDIIDDADLILTMSLAEREAVVAAHPRARRRTFTLIEYGRLNALLYPMAPLREHPLMLADGRDEAQLGPADDILTPRGRDEEAYRKTASAIAENVRGLAEAWLAMAPARAPHRDPLGAALLLDAGADAELVHVDAFGVPVDIRCTGDGGRALARRLREAWSRVLRDPAAAAPEAPIVVEAIVADDLTEVRVARARGAIGGDTTGDVMHSLAGAVTVRAIDQRAGEVIMLHAAGLALPDGRVVAFVAPSGTGKTTLSRTLGKAFGYVSDETVVINFDGTVTPYPKPLSVIRSGHHLKRQLSPDAEGLLVAPSGLRLARIVLLTREPDAVSPVIEDVPLLPGIAELSAQVSYLPRLAEPLRSLARVIERTGGLARVTYAEASDLIDLVPVLAGGEA